MASSASRPNLIPSSLCSHQGPRSSHFSNHSEDILLRMHSDPGKGPAAAAPSLDEDISPQGLPPDEAAEPPRKRAKYVERACNRCKKKKVRCDGQMPCNQCETRGRRDCCYGSFTAHAPAHQASNWPSEYPSGWGFSGGVDNTIPPNLTYVCLAPNCAEFVELIWRML